MKLPETATVEVVEILSLRRLARAILDLVCGANLVGANRVK